MRQGTGGHKTQTSQGTSYSSPGASKSVILGREACPERTSPQCCLISYPRAPPAHWAPCSSSQVLSTLLTQDICTAISLTKRLSCRYYPHFTQGSAQLPPLPSGLPSNSYVCIWRLLVPTQDFVYLHVIYSYLMYHKPVCSLTYCLSLPQEYKLHEGRGFVSFDALFL